MILSIVVAIYLVSTSLWLWGVFLLVILLFSAVIYIYIRKSTTFYRIFATLLVLLGSIILFFFMRPIIIPFILIDIAYIFWIMGVANVTDSYESAGIVTIDKTTDIHHHGLILLVYISSELI